MCYDGADFQPLRYAVGFPNCRMNERHCAVAVCDCRLHASRSLCSFGRNWTGPGPAGARSHCCCCHPSRTGPHTDNLVQSLIARMRHLPAGFNRARQRRGGEGQGSLGASAWAGERWRGGSSGRDPWRGRAQSRGRRRRAVAGRAGPGGRGRVHSGGRRGRARPGRAGEAAHGRASERGLTGVAERRSGRARTGCLEFTEQTGKNHSLLFIMSRMIWTVSLVIGRPAASARSIAALILRCISGVMALA